MQADVIDAAQLAQLRASMSQAKYAMLLEMFAKELDTHLALLREAWAGNDRGRTAMEAHIILGLAGNMAMARLAGTARSLEAMAPEAPAALIGQTIATILEQAAQARRALAAP